MTSLLKQQKPTLVSSCFFIFIFGFGRAEWEKCQSDCCHFIYSSFCVLADVNQMVALTYYAWFAHAHIPLFCFYKGGPLVFCHFVYHMFINIICSPRHPMFDAILFCRFLETHKYSCLNQCGCRFALAAQIRTRTTHLRQLSCLIFSSIWLRTLEWAQVGCSSQWRWSDGVRT